MERTRNRLAEWIDCRLDLMDTSPKFGWVVGLALMVLSLIPRFMHDLSSDSAEYLYLAGRMLDGERYYYNFFEYNVPFPILIYTLPVAIARLLEIPVPIIAKIFVSVLMLASIFCVHLLLRKSREWSSPLRYNALIISLFYCVNFLSASNEFATKTVLFVCLVLPYMFSLQLRMEQVSLSRNWNVAISVMLGIAVCLKPFYALFPLVTESYMAVKQRNIKVLFRWQNMIAAGIFSAAYFIVLPFLFPEYLKLIPYFFEFYDGAFFGTLDRGYVLISVLMACLPFLVWYFALRHYLDRLANYGVFFAVLAAEVAISNTETVLSLDQLSLLLFFTSLPFLYSILLFSRHVGAKEAVPVFKKMMATIALLVGIISTFRLISVLDRFDPTPIAREQITREIVRYINEYAPHAPVYSLSDNTEHVPPFTFYVSKRPYQVFPQHRMFYNIEWRAYRARYHGEPLTESAKLADTYFMKTITDFFTSTPPKLVFVNTINASHNIYCLPNLLELLLAHSGEFKALWQKGNYQKIGTIVPQYVHGVFEDETEVRHATLDIGDIAYEVTFPPKNEVSAKLDVYLRKD